MLDNGVLKILVRATSWLGDAVMSLPALRALRRRFSEAQIAVVARPWVAGLYRREPCADLVLAYPARWSARLRLAQWLRAQRFTHAVLFPNSFEAAVAPWLARIPHRIGYDRDGRGRLLTCKVKPPSKGAHETYYYLELLLRAGLLEELPPAEPVVLSGIGQARRDGERLFAAMGARPPVIGLSPGAQNSRAKQWPAESFAEAAGRLSKRLNASVAIFGSIEERSLGQKVAEALRRQGRPVLNLAGETGLEEFIALAAACRLFLTNDSGAMHVASALTVPTVAIFGPTDWAATAPAGPCARIVRESVACAPCMLRDCPIDHRCMKRIPPERVAQAALELLNDEFDENS